MKNEEQNPEFEQSLRNRFYCNLVDTLGGIIDDIITNLFNLFVKLLVLLLFNRYVILILLITIPTLIFFFLGINPRTMEQLEKPQIENVEAID